MIRLAYDMHIHSCLSPCGDDDMTPANIAGMAYLNNLQLIALTDHNTVKNCDSLKKAAKKYGILTLYGMELTTQEEVHTVCLFPNKASADEWNEYVYSRLMKIKNNPDIFGKQIIMDENDNILGEEEYLLINATEIPFDKVFKAVKSLGGIAYPAHIDKAANSLISNLGFIPPDSDFKVAEFSNKDNIETVSNEHPYLKNCRFVCNSDAHYLQNINTAVNYLETEELSADSVIVSLSRCKE